MWFQSGGVFLALVGSGGCTQNITKDQTLEDSGYAWHDTSAVPDTSTDESGDSTPVDTTTGETAETDTQDTGTAPDPFTALDLYPGALVVNPTATYPLRAVATDARGERAAAAGVTYSSDDEAVATVAPDGTVTAIGAGSTTVHAWMDGLEALSTVEVRADLLADVTVVDALTGLPLAGVHVKLPDTQGELTDAAGFVQLPMLDGLAATFTVFAPEGYDAITFCDTVSRTFVVPLMPKQRGGADGTVHGQVDFGAVPDAAWDEAVIGLVVASVQGNLATLTLGDLFAEERALTVLGVDAEVPANIVIEGTAEDYYVAAYPGDVGSWGLAGPIPLGEASSGLATTADALHLLVDHLPDMTWGWTSGGVAVSDTQIELDLSPPDAFTTNQNVVLPALSLGFRGDEEFLVLATEERPNEGYVVTGLGLGTTSASVLVVAPGTVSGSMGSEVLVYAEVGGLGSGGASSTAVGPVDATGTVHLPELQDVPTVVSWDPVTRALAVSADSDADYVRIRLEDNRHNKHELYVPGSWSGTLPNAVSEFRRAQASVEVLAVESEVGAYEERVSSGDLGPDGLIALTAARTLLEN